MISRMEKLQALLKVELSQILREQIDLEDNVFITIVRIIISRTLEHATVFISVLPEQKTKQLLSLIDGYIYTIQQALNKRLVLRKIPKLSFKLDTTEQHAAHIEKLIENSVK